MADLTSSLCPSRVAKRNNEDRQSHKVWRLAEQSLARTTMPSWPIPPIQQSCAGAARVPVPHYVSILNPSHLDPWV